MRLSCSYNSAVRHRGSSSRKQPAFGGITGFLPRSLAKHGGIRAFSRATELVSGMMLAVGAAHKSWNFGMSAQVTDVRGRAKKKCPVRVARLGRAGQPRRRDLAGFLFLPADGSNAGPVGRLCIHSGAWIPTSCGTRPSARGIGADKMWTSRMPWMSSTTSCPARCRTLTTMRRRAS
jgi:hypothetical protein